MLSQRSNGSKTRAGKHGRHAAMSKSLAGVAYSAVRAVQQVGQEGGKFGEKSGNLRSRCGFARTQAFWHGWRGIFCRARSGLQHDCLDMFTKRDTETQPHRHTETRTQALFLTASARHCPCPGCKSLLGHGPAPARELVCTVQAPAARCAPKSNVLETRTLLWSRHGCS